MLEKNTHQPDRMPRMRPTRRGIGVLALAAAVAGGVLVSAGRSALDSTRESNRIYRQLSQPDALAQYEEGNIDRSKVVVVTAPRNMTAWELAESLDPTGDIRELSDPLSVQAGKNGVTKGERFVVSRNVLPSDSDAAKSGS